jgi:hypothetical protein
MISEVKQLACGPYRPGQEASLKADVIAARERQHPALRHFRLETGAVEPGLPDVLSVNKTGYVLIEFKVSDARGVLHFQRSQPLFYRKFPELNICILAWDAPGDRLLVIDPKDVVAAKTLWFPCPKGSVPVLVAQGMFPALPALWALP